MEKVQQLTEAIAADGFNPKLHSQRCTAYLEVQDYVKALEDAKVLVRMLPDAPMGYLKAARCYRLLRRWKAAQKMLDTATEMSDDETTLRAIRSEMRKLQLAEKEPLPSFIAVLPEELFIEALSYLPTSDIFHAAAVSQRWRRVVHSRKELWHTMVFLLKSGLDKEFRRLDDKIEFYLERLEGTSLKHLTIGLTALPDTYPTAQKKPMTAYKDAVLEKLSTNGMLSALLSLWTVNLYREDNLSTLLRPNKSVLLHFKVTLSGGIPLPATISPMLMVFRCPKLQTIAISDRPYQSDSFTQRYLRYSSVPAKEGTLVGVHSRPQPMASLRNLCIQSPQLIRHDGTDDPSGHMFDELEHLVYEGRGLFIPRPPRNLKSLTLGGGGPFEIAEIPDRGNANANAHFEKLEELRFLAGVPSGSVHALVHRTHSPHLRSFHLASSLVTGLNGQPDPFLAFVKRHPLLEELKISSTTVGTLTHALPLLPQLQRLSLVQSDLDANLLDQATVHLPLLRYLDVSHCANIKSGPLLRLVKAKIGQLEELGIEGCRELQKEAVDWLKANVKVVRWMGWRDRNEIRGWNVR